MPLIESTGLSFQRAEKVALKSRVSIGLPVPSPALHCKTRSCQVPGLIKLHDDMQVLSFFFLPVK